MLSEILTRLGLADLELLVVISGAERWCLGVLLRASLWAKLISDVSDSEKLLVLESEGVNFFHCVDDVYVTSEGRHNSD